MSCVGQIVGVVGWTWKGDPGGGGEDDFVRIEDLIITCVESFDFHDNAITCFLGVGGSLMKV